MRSVLPFFFITFLLPFSVSAQTVPAFDVTVLPEFPGSTSVASDVAVNVQTFPNDMFVAGSSTDAIGVERATVWSFTDFTFDNLTPLPPLSPTMDSWANTVAHDSGGATTYVAGASIDPLGMMKPVYWSKADAESVYSPPMMLPTLAGGEGEAVSFQGQPVDFDGTQANFLVGSSTTGGDVEKAVVWMRTPPGPFTITTLPHAGPLSAGSALGFEYDGINRFACGWAVDTGDTIPQVWKSTDQGGTWTRTALPLLPGGSAGLGSDAGCGDNRIFVVGWSEISGGSHHAALWESTDGGQGWIVTDLGTANSLPNSEGYVVGIGGAFVAGGRSYGFPGTEVATLWLDDGMTTIPYDLNSLLVSTSSYVLRNVTGYWMPDVLIYQLAPGSQFCGVGTNALPGPGRAAVGPHAFVARVVGATDVKVAVEAEDRLQVTVSPNPFARTTEISFTLPSRSSIQLAVHDVAGRRVALLARGERAAGCNSVSWSARDENGSPVSPGVYFVRLEVAGEAAIEKVVRLK